MPVVMPYKLVPPRTEGQVLRHRQVGALDERLQRHELVWLLGLPGAGKTSVAAQWLARAEGRRSVWYRLDEDDADIAGLLDALRRHPVHGDAARLPAWSPEHQTELRSFARQFFQQWLALAPEPLTLVFDDCHRLPEDAPLFELLDAAREVAAGTQGRLSFLLISRRPPGLPLSRGLVPGWLSVYDDLALAGDEAAAVARAVSGQDWSAERLAQAQGWLAHVLALARAEGRAAPGATLSEYLAEEILALLPADARRGLRLAAELPELPRGLVKLAPPAVRLLDELAQRRYFVELNVDLTAGDAWRLHDLLRDGLRERNRALETPQALAAARRDCAAWVRERQPDIAMGLLVASGDEPAALALLADEGRRWLAQGRHRQVLSWLDALPGDAQPVRALWRAEALLPLAPEDARPLFARSRAAFVAAGSAEQAYRAWCGEVASYVVQWGAVQGLAELVDELEPLQAVLGEPPGEWRWRVAADALTALMYGRAEDPRIARHAQATALAVAQAPDAASRITAAAQLLIYRLWWAGDFPGGRALYDAFDAEVERGGAELPPLARLIWWSNSAIIDWQCGDPARCHAKVAQGLALADASGIHVRDFFLLTQGIFCALSQEDWPRAEGYLARLALTERGHKRLDSMVHHFFRSWYALSRGDAALALAHARTAAPLADSLGSLFHQVIVLSALAPACLHAGDRAGAEAAYRAQLALAKNSGNLTFTYIAFCAGAEIALQQGDEAGLAKQVERMLRVKQLGGFHSDCGWRGPMRARLLAFALAHGILPDVARQWIREKRLPPPPGFDAMRWPMPVRIRALGALEVEVDDPAAAPPGGTKPPAKLRDLLAVLVVRHRRGATQSELSDWLWPDTDGDKAAASLKVAVHRLRAWLGHDAVLLRNGVLALNELCVSCDLWPWLDQPLAVPAALAGLLLAGCQAPPVQQLRERLKTGH
ncbi:AAA family ATPase [Roseateles sp.]|uniref:AAA family ATPase n=1 Tax=Roseateles sp. TaxID=1971397 RepID=UPI003BA9353A